ncbi:MAG: aldo/keto reductase, partial [Chloroflexota bacterium]|nr:aldo/keto reductase [Chloroflexota bacterium]
MEKMTIDERYKYLRTMQKRYRKSDRSQSGVLLGKIRRYGISNLPEEGIETFFRNGNITSLMLRFNSVERGARQKLLPLCRAHNVGGIAYSVTGRGMLTGKLPQQPEFEAGDTRNLDPLFQCQRYQSGLRLAAKLAEIGDRYGKTPAQTAIAWVLSHDGVTCALTGPATIAHLEENIDASGWELSVDDLQELEVHFQQEEERLLKVQQASLERILPNPLQQDPLEAFMDIMNVIEIALCLNLVSSEEIFSLYLE